MSTSITVYTLYKSILVQTSLKVIKGYQAIKETEIYSLPTTDSSRTVVTADDESPMKVNQIDIWLE